MAGWVLDKLGVAQWLDDIGIGSLIRFLISVAWAILIVYIIFFIGRRIFFKRLRSTDRIQVRFIENILRVVVILNAVFWVLNQGSETLSFGKLVFQSTAIFSAIVGLAAQPVISDIVCGIMIIASRPFEIGDRIELKDGTAGVVKDINLRHVVLAGMDSIETIVPNSLISSMSLSNMSKNRGRRSAFMKFSVAYGTDVEKAMDVIRNVVISCPYTIEGFEGKYGYEYGPVYFLEYGESALILATTIYHKRDVSTALVKTDVNLRISRAFEANGIEIPFNYLNVVMKNEDISADEVVKN